jgi:hypothetical protein
MKLKWIPIALLSSTVIAGCNKPSQENAQNFDQSIGAPTAAAPPSATDQTGAPSSAGAQGTTGIAGPTETAGAHHANVDRPLVVPDVPVRPSRTVAARSTARAASTLYREVTVPAGTSLPLELTTALSSDTAHVETPVRARLRDAVIVKGFTAIPAGTVFNGTVTDVEESGRVKGRATLTFRFDEATVNGVREQLSTEPLTFRAEATKSEDATKIGAGAGIGAAIGAIVGGGKGAAKGAAIGGAAGTGAVLATKGKDIRLPAGANLTTTLEEPVHVRAR